MVKKIQENFPDDLSEYGPLNLMHFDLTLPLYSQKVKDEFEFLYNENPPLKESEEKKKLFIPRKLSGEDSRYSKWNKEQPIVDGERINQYNIETGLKDGLWETYHTNGKLDSKIGYKNGDYEGIYQTFHINGKIQYDGQTKGGEFDGLWKMYHQNGNLKEIGSYVDGKPNGIWKTYYPFNNQFENNNLLSSIGNYINGKVDGLWVDYFMNGKVSSKSIYNMAKRIAFIMYNMYGTLDNSMNWKDEYDNMVIKEQMEDKENILKSFEPKKELNPKVWDEDDKLKKKIKDTLVAIGQEFHKSLEVEAPIEDIIFTGSLANYNWSQYSDVDLHVLIDFNEFDDKELIKKYFDAKKAVWNDNHNIKIKGYDVELYAQDKDEPHESTGIYSVMNDEWIKKPKPQDVKIDRETIKKKVRQFEIEYNRIVESYKEEKYEETRKALDKLKDKIKKYRKAGLDKGGEMATENLVFKTMRRSGLIEKIYKLGLETTDKEYTIETIDESEHSKKGKLFIPRRIDERLKEWNEIQPIIDGKKINQYDLTTRNMIGRWGEGDINAGNTINLFFTYWDVFNDSEEFDFSDSDNMQNIYDNMILRIKDNFPGDISEYGPLNLMYFDLTIPLNGKEVWEEFKKLYNEKLPLTKNINEGKINDNIDDILKNFKKTFGLDIGFLMTFGGGINALIRNLTSLIKQYTVQPLNSFELTNLVIAMIVVYLRKNKSLKDFKNEMLSITAFATLIPAYSDLINSLLGNVDFMEAFMTIIKSAGVYTMLSHFKSK
jgi:antitoxin component YwqK of YwqJK toxin-antitoxin module